MKRKLTNIEINKQKWNKELNSILENKLPFFCMDFFVGIAMRTSLLTQINYARDLYIFFDFLVKKVNHFYGKDILSLTLDDLNALESKDLEYYLKYLNFYVINGIERTNDSKGKARKLSAVRSMLSYFYKNNKIQENVGVKVSSPKIPEKPIVRLEPIEIEKILDLSEAKEKFSSVFQDKYNAHTSKRDYAIIALLLGTGIRVSECTNLNIFDVDFKNNAFNVIRKGGNSVILYFSDEVKEALVEYLPERQNRLLLADRINEENAFFISLQNTRISQRAVENIVKKYSKLVNPLKNVSPHKLRSTFGTEMYKKTKDIYVVAEVLGHKDVNTTKKHYAAISEEIKMNAVKNVSLRNNDKNNST
ncbi:MAG: Tyrosine recombinase XerD [Firmicutes bacterium ADurb.Bin080]|jgi:integrase/recombinase XerC|nr:tyrosine-type recombinase/integrase [Clostridiales bacterium]OQC16456.1 MAG: Tyrosine recombinase XerD [Firmicutes bacterium ADurb.Bin080]